MWPRASARARATTHFSGSLSRNWMNAVSMAGSAPIRNNHFQEPAPSCSAATPMPIRPADTLPTADNDCSTPSARGRTTSGNESATNATDSPNTPPTPSPVMKR